MLCVTIHVLPHELIDLPFRCRRRSSFRGKPSRHGTGRQVMVSRLRQASEFFHLFSYPLVRTKKRERLGAIISQVGFARLKDRDGNNAWVKHM
jgi:hypothetical protein